MDGVPDYLEPLRGYRVWRVFDGAPLQSLCGTWWPPYEALEALPCPTFPGGARTLSGIGCGGPPCDDGNLGHRRRCGIYAFSTRDELYRVLGHELVMFRRGPFVAGEVWLWGRIVRHEYGYRAQYAYPAKFTGGFLCDPVHIAAMYGVSSEEDASWTSVVNSLALSRSRCRPLFPPAPVRPRSISAAAMPTLPAVSLSTSPQPQSGTGEPPRPCRSLLLTCKRLATWNCRSEMRRVLEMIRGSHR